MTDLPPNITPLRAFRITRPCGCVEVVIDKPLSVAKKKGEKACFNHEREAKQLARIKEKGGLLCDVCGRPPWNAWGRAGKQCNREGQFSYDAFYHRGCPGTLQKVKGERQ
jgi:hypothetical protein